ncbi:MAG TPA: hypothetical protein VFW52_01575 [Candidatus Saccharimonadales bacterium]|nr:hypothetical protein [Candidatus Saccharimonadales bacterium]
MTKTIALKAAALSTMGLGLVGGLVGMAGAQSLSTEGPDSPIRVHSRNHQTWTNNNSVGVGNHNWQSAYTGRAEVEHNTTGGSARSGDASNDNSLDAAISISNSSGGGGSNGTSSANMSTTGPDSPIRVRTSNNTSVTNNNDVHVYNSSSQHASTGSAEVEGNTTGGNATSGDATNTNSTSVTIDVSN